MIDGNNLALDRLCNLSHSVSWPLWHAQNGSLCSLPLQVPASLNLSTHLPSRTQPNVASQYPGEHNTAQQTSRRIGHDSNYRRSVTGLHILEARVAPIPNRPQRYP